MLEHDATAYPRSHSGVMLTGLRNGRGCCTNAGVTIFRDREAKPTVAEHTGFGREDTGPTIVCGHLDPASTLGRDNLKYLWEVRTIRMWTVLFCQADTRGYVTTLLFYAEICDPPIDAEWTVLPNVGCT